MFRIISALIVVPALVVSGCQSVGKVSRSEAAEVQQAPYTQELTPDLAAELEDICELPAGALTSEAAVSDDTFSKLSCAISEAQQRGVTIGFISNPVDPNR